MIEEHGVLRSKNPKSFYDHVNGRVIPRDHLTVLIDNDGRIVTEDAERELEVLLKEELLRNLFEAPYSGIDEMRRRSLTPGLVLPTPYGLQMQCTPIHCFRAILE